MHDNHSQLFTTLSKQGLGLSDVTGVQVVGVSVSAVIICLSSRDHNVIGQCTTEQASQLGDDLSRHLPIDVPGKLATDISQSIFPGLDL